jgi:uncharacterized repeat protein (TIGR03847 family)
VTDRVELGEAELFTATAIGRPGERVFSVHVRTRQQRVTIKCEKQQVAALGEYLMAQLHDLPAPESEPLAQTLEVGDPGEPFFVLGAIGISYDQDDDRFLLSFQEAVPVDADDEQSAEPAETTEPAEPDNDVRFTIDRGQAKAFAERAEQLVAAGRPVCMFCGRPIDLDGHACPRMN